MDRVKNESRKNNALRLFISSKSFCFCLTTWFAFVLIIQLTSLRLSDVLILTTATIKLLS